MEESLIQNDNNNRLPPLNNQSFVAQEIENSRGGKQKKYDFFVSLSLYTFIIIDTKR